MSVALYTTVLNPEIPRGRKFTNRKGKIWLGRGTPPPATPSKRPGNLLTIAAGQSAMVEQPFGLFTSGAGMVKATKTWTVSGTPVPGTIAVLPLILAVNGIARLIEYQYVVQVADTNILIATAMRGLLASVNNSAGVTTHCFVKGYDSLGGEDIAAVALAMIGIFGTDEAAAFVDNGDGSITLTVGANGTDGNNTQIGGYFLNSMPSPMPTEDSNGAPQEPGMYCIGDFTEWNLANPTGNVAYTPGNTGTVVNTPTVSSLSLDSGCYFNTSYEVLSRLQGSNAVSNDGSNNVIMPGGGTSAGVLVGSRVAFIFDNDFGTYDRADIWRALFSDLTTKWKIDAADPVPLKGNPQYINGRGGDPFGILRFRY